MVRGKPVKEPAVIKQSKDEALKYADSIFNTVREPLIGLDQDLRVFTVNRSFYEAFQVEPEETIGQLIYDLGNKQWDIPRLRDLLETILPQKTTFDNYEVEHDFATIGKRIMLLNARQIQRVVGKEQIILLAIEDITERKEIESGLKEASDALNSLNDQLEEKVKQRTSELVAEVAQRIKAEESIERLNMVLHALRNINKLITKENDREKLLKGACDMMTETRGYRTVWIALIDDADKILFTAESGLGKAFQPVLKQLQHGEMTECGRHVLNQPGLFIKDPSTDCVDCPLARTCGEKMVVIARLNHGTKTYGMLAASLPIDVPPDMEEQSLFQELVDDIAFGLHKIEMEEQRKKAEEAVSIAVEKYRALVENINDVLLLLDTQGNITYVSPVVEQLSKYKVSDLIGKPFTSLIYPDDLPDLLDRFNSLMDGELKPWEFRVVDKDGRVIFVRTSSRPLYEDGQVMGITTLMTDITEGKLSEEKLLKSHESLKKTLNDAINTMVKIVEIRDPYTAGHQQRVADLATAIAGEMKLEDTRIDQLKTAAMIHDIGKMYIPSDILSKPGRLSDIEFNLIKTHAQGGYDIVKGMDFPCVVAQTILQHHERLDGSGYPNQLKGEYLLLEAKILAVADVVEAMASHRPYRPALGIDKALEEISKNRGRLYDPCVVDICLDIFKKKDFELEI